MRAVLSGVLLGIVAGLLLATTVWAEDGAAAASARENVASATPARQPMPRREGMVRLDETVISGNQELPKVLYIVPWQDPTGAPQIEISPEFSESQVFRRLYPPAYRRELEYYEMLDAEEAEE